jgi:Bacterial Ig-like domain (group 3)/Beta-propeller repeat
MKPAPSNWMGTGMFYIMGLTGTGFPMVNPIEPFPTGGSQQVLVAELDPTGANLLFSTLVGSGGLNPAVPVGLAVDSLGNIYLAGNTNGRDLITTPGTLQETSSSGPCCWKGFVVKIAAQGTASAALQASPSPAQSGATVTLTATVSAPQKYASTPTGTVTFQNGSTVLGSANLDPTGTAIYSTSSLAPGTCTLTAGYSGDSTYAAASATATLTINAPDTPSAISPKPAARGNLTVNTPRSSKPQ